MHVNSLNTIGSCVTGPVSPLADTDDISIQSTLWVTVALQPEGEVVSLLLFFTSMVHIVAPQWFAWLFCIQMEVLTSWYNHLVPFLHCFTLAQVQTVHPHKCEGSVCSP